MMKDSCMLLVIHYYKCFFCNIETEKGVVSESFEKQ